MTTPPWPPEHISRLRELWATGLSASKIADELNANAIGFHGYTRNSVIGKVHRLYLPPRAVAVRKKAAPRTIFDRSQTAVDLGCAPRPRNWGYAPISVKRPLAMPEASKPAPEPVVGHGEAYGALPTSRLVTIMRLRDGLCRWPCWDIEPNGLYCGATCEIDEAYCAGHRRMAYSSSTRSERRAAEMPREVAA